MPISRLDIKKIISYVKAFSRWKWVLINTHYLCLAKITISAQARFEPSIIHLRDKGSTDNDKGLLI